MNGLFLVAAIFEALAGIGFEFIPGALLSRLGVAPEPLAIAVTRVLGTAVLAFAVLLWLARRSADNDCKRRSAMTMFAYYLLSTFALLHIQLSGVVNVMGWGVLGSHAALALAFGYVLTKKSA